MGIRGVFHILDDGSLVLDGQFKQQELRNLADILREELKSGVQAMLTVDDKTQGDPVIWAGRLCKIEDGVWMLSRQGDWANWDFFPKELDGKQAVTGTCGPIGDEIGKVPAYRTINMLPIDDDRLLIVCEGGSLWLLVGNPNTNGRIDMIWR